MPPSARLRLSVPRQPDDFTCGPTCLSGVYSYYGQIVPVERIAGEVRKVAGGGTLAVLLALHALSRGFDATIYTFNLRLFDPTWFPRTGGPADPARLAERMHAQNEHKGRDDEKFRAATEGYLHFLEAGGRVCMQDLTSRMILRLLRRGTPVLTGLSSTYLYHTSREYGPQDDADDVRGVPSGHFVVLSGYNTATKRVTVADPLHDNPGFNTHEYEVPMARLVGAIMLGVLTYDGNLLVIEPKAQGPADGDGPVGRGTREADGR